MSFSKSHVAKNLIKGYVNTPLPLKEQTLEYLALKICHNSKLNEHIFFPKLDFAILWSPMQVRKQWEKIIIKEATEVCKTLLLPRRIQKELIGQIRSIALQLLIWSGEWKKMFNISCHFNAHFWKPTDWSEGRINERKIAERAVQDHTIPYRQRYNLACVYCLEEFILPLWDQIPLQHRDHYVLFGPVFIRNSGIVRIWSELMRGPRFHTYEYFLRRICLTALLEQQTTAFIYSWNKLSVNIKRKYITPFYNTMTNMNARKDEHRNLPFMEHHKICLPPSSAYGDIFCFILSQLIEEKRTGFQINSQTYESIEHFLEWPN